MKLSESTKPHRDNRLGCPNGVQETHTLEDVQAGLRDLPHSRQDDLRQGVINPQNGHILCNRTSCACGVSVSSSFPKKLVTGIRRLRSRLRNSRNTGSIDPPSSLMSNWVGNCSVTGGITGVISDRRTARDFASATHNYDRLIPPLLCRIAHIAHEYSAYRAISAPLNP
jgi:hypothetical protein